MYVKNLFYWSYLYVIGGVETFLYEMAKKYGSTHEIAVVYSDGHPDQIARLSKYARCIKFCGQYFECDVAVFGLGLDIISHIDAKEYIQVLHADYRKQGLTPSSDPRITRFIGVSDNTCKTAEEDFGIKCELVYNPLQIDKPRKMLRLVSATRLSSQKAPWRMEKLAKALDDAGVCYDWQIFSDVPGHIVSPNVVYRKPKLDISEQIANADFLVQLSESEGYSYSIIEALMVGTPVIVTPLGMNEEAGIVDGKNAIVIPFDMSEIPIDRIKKMPKFKYTNHPDGWDKILAEGVSDWAERMKQPTEIRVVRIYHDVELEREVLPGEVLKVTHERAHKLSSLGLAEYINDADL